MAALMQIEEELSACDTIAPVSAVPFRNRGDV
jgi:hypothetical protein